MTATSSITIRRTRRDDVPAVIAMLADDHLGRARERLEHPLPASYYDAFERVDRDLYRLHREDIPELGVPLAVVRQGLADHGLHVLEMTGLDGEPGTDESSRVFIAAAAR